MTITVAPSLRKPSTQNASWALASNSIVLSDHVTAGTISIENGIIVDIAEDRILASAVDARGAHVIPGLVELHTDHLEPHYAPRPGVLWSPAAAVLSYDAQIATSGITTVFDCLRAGHDGDRNKLSSGLFQLADAIVDARRAGRLRVDHRLHLRCEISSNDVLLDAEQFVERYAVDLISLMDHTPGERQYRDEEKLRAYYRGKAGKTEAELDELVGRRKADRERNHDRHRAALLELARKYDIVIASHDDTTPAHVNESLADGVRLAEFPTTVEAAEACRAAGIAVMMGAPNIVRGGSHSGNVSARLLAERGLLDVLSSDYVPSSLLQAAVMLADVPSVGGLAPAIGLVTRNPAAAADLSDRGAIAVGKRADLLVADLTGIPLIHEVIAGGRRVA